MTVDLKPYPAYKDSGVPWLGRVPEQWEVQHAKKILRVIDVRSTKGDEELLTVSSEHGVIRRSTAVVTMFKAESYEGYKLCWPGDLVINNLWAWAGGLGVSQYHGIVSSAYSVYRPRAECRVDTTFIHELVRSVPFQWELQVRSKGIWISRLQLTEESFLNAPIPTPPFLDQVAIVRYLDYVDRRIRKYIRAKQRLIALLNEQKQAIIQRAVTRGLDPNVRLKPSGVPWLGDIPEHWEVARLKHLCRFSYGDPLPTEIRQDGGIPVFGSNGCVGPHSVANTHAPCIVIGRKGSFGKINFSETPVFAIDTTYFVDDRCTHANLHWLVYLLASLGLDGVSKDSAVPGLDRGDAYDLVVAYPIDTPEQSAIAQYLDRATAGLNCAIDATRHEIDLLREYRTRLIADVVTGKLDVRDAAANLPDESEMPPEPCDEEPAEDMPDLESEEESDDEQAET